VVNPWTTCVVSPDFLFFSASLKMSPAPRNPTPDGIAAAIREESQDMGPSKNANAELMENKHAPSDTRLMVRMPAGRSASRRSYPTMPPLNRRG